MATSRLTATKIDRYKSSRRDEILSDGNGLSIRFRQTRSGELTRTWLYVYKAGTRSIYLTLGEHGTALPDFDKALYKLPANAKLTLDTARRIAIEIRVWRQLGTDPKKHIEDERSNAVLETAAKLSADLLLQEKIKQEKLTVQDLFDSWIVDGVRRKDGNATLIRLFQADVLPQIGNIAVRRLNEHDIRSVLRFQVSRGVNRTAVITRNSLTQMFAWAQKRQPWRRFLAEGNPMELIEIQKIVSPNYDLSNQRDRVLSDDEISELSVALCRSEQEYFAAPDKRIATQPLEKKTQCAIWIMLSTLCRVGELTMARWEHVDLDSGEWFIPKENVKKKTSHLLIYLSQFSLQQFRLLFRLTGHSAWCFPGRTDTNHMDLKAITKQIGDRQCLFKKGNVGKNSTAETHRRLNNTLVLANGTRGAWSPHDLRRTGATMMQALGTSLDTIDRCQNHIIFGSKVRRVYLRHDYADEKRGAWERLGQQLQALCKVSEELTMK